MHTPTPRYESGERAPRFEQRPAPQRPLWIRATLVSAAVALTGLLVGAAMGFIGPSDSGTVIETSTEMQTLPPVKN